MDNNNNNNNNATKSRSKSKSRVSSSSVSNMNHIRILFIVVVIVCIFVSTIELRGYYYDYDDDTASVNAAAASSPVGSATGSTTSTASAYQYAPNPPPITNRTTTTTTTTTTKPGGGGNNNINKAAAVPAAADARQRGSSGSGNDVMTTYHKNIENSSSTTSFFEGGVKASKQQKEEEEEEKTITTNTNTNESNNNDDDEKKKKNQQQQQQPPKKKICVVVRTYYPFPPAAINMIQNLHEGFKNYSSKYHVMVRVDETQAQNQNQQQKKMVDVDGGGVGGSSSSSSSSSNNIIIESLQYHIPTINFTYKSNVAPITLQELLSSYPILSQYLYNSTANTNNKKGDCCKKQPMWQLLTPNDVHFVLNYSKDKCTKVWMVEDDVSVIGDNMTLSQVIMDMDEKLEISQDSASFVAILNRQLLHGPNRHFINTRHTHNFHNLLEKSMKIEIGPKDILINHQKHTKWLCASDCIRRYTIESALALDDGLKNQNMFAWAETFPQPVLWDHNISIHWWHPPAVLGNFLDKKTLEEATIEMESLKLANKSSWALYQRHYRQEERNRIEKEKENNNTNTNNNNSTPTNVMAFK